MFSASVARSISSFVACSFALGAFGLPMPAGAQSDFSSGCSGNGPGILSGRVPNFGPDTSGTVRIVNGDAGGDALVDVIQQQEASKQWLLKTFGTQQDVSAFEKNPSSYLSTVGGFQGDIHDPNAVLAFEQKALATRRMALGAVSSTRLSSIAKDGSFTCRGLESGKYHVIVTMNHAPASAIVAGPNATGISRTTLEANVEVPRVKPGTKVLVQVTQYAVLSSLKR
jgi:hypothetical protein